MIYRLKLPSLTAPDHFGWVYRLYLGDEVVYVGQTSAKHPMCRIGQHFSDKLFDGFSAELVPIEALLQEEAKQIDEIAPKYNKRKGGRICNEEHFTTPQLDQHSKILETALTNKKAEPVSVIDAINLVSFIMKNRGRPINSLQRARAMRFILKKVIKAKVKGRTMFHVNEILISLPEIVSAMD